MKTLHAVIFFAFLGVSLSGKLTEDMLLPGDKECIVELGIETQAVLDSVDDNFLTTEGDPKLNDLIVCSYKKLNIIDANNEVKYDALKTLFASYVEWLDKDIVDKDKAANDAIEACKDLEGNGLGDYLVKLGNCVVKKTTKV